MEVVFLRDPGVLGVIVREYSTGTYVVWFEDGIRGVSYFEFEEFIRVTDVGMVIDE